MSRMTALTVAWIEKVAFAVCMISLTLAQQPRNWRDDLPTAWGPLTDGWQLAIACEKQSYRGNEPLRFRLVAQNESAKSIRAVLTTSPWRMADFKVIRAGDGKVLALRPSRDERERLERGAASQQFVVVAPGRTVSIGELDLRQLFDLSAGTYSVIATAKLTSPTAIASTPVRSNEITVTILGQ